jgi:hypothetical protein
MIDSIKAEALNAPCYKQDHMDTSLQKSSIVNFRSLQVRRPMPVIPNNLIFWCTSVCRTYTVTVIWLKLI